MKYEKTCLWLYALLVFMVPCLAMTAALDTEGEETQGKEWRTTKKSWWCKVDKALEAQDQVMVVYLPKGVGQYGLTCDLSQENVLVKHDYGSSHYKTIQPLTNVLSDQFLRGLRLEAGKLKPAMRVNFGIKDANLEDYELESFLSQHLKAFLSKDCRALEKKDKVVFDGFAQALTEDVREVMLGSGDLQWTIEEPQCLVAMATKDERKRASVFVIVGGNGILKGELERYCLCDLKNDERVVPGCLFDYKLNTVFDDLQTTYPFSEENYKKCLNYETK